MKMLFGLVKSKQEKQFEEEKVRIEQLLKAVEALGEIPKDKTIFQYAVALLNIKCTCEDAGEFSAAPVELQKYQASLNALLFDSGSRHKHWHNRTAKGEKVTLGNTFWGDIYRVWTYSGDQWIRKDQDYWTGFNSFWNCNYYNGDPLDRDVVVDFQVKPYLERNRKELISACRALLGKAA